MPLLTPKHDPAVVFLRQLRWPVTWRRPLLPSLIRGACTGIFCVVSVFAFQMTVGDNLRVVQPQQIFRAGQMEPARLQSTIRERGVRTIVNLRGFCGDFDWYRDECRATRDAGIAQEDITLSAIRLPTPSEVRRLVEVIDRSEYPILLHCRQGVDRTGLASAMVKLLEPQSTVAGAERQLSLAYGYVPYNGTENMRRFLVSYREWLGRLELVHSPELFRHWAIREYCPGACRAEIEFLDWSAEWRADESRIVRIRVTNASVRTWAFCPGTNRGVHARYRVHSADESFSVDERAGLFDAAIPPGQSIILELGIPPLPPGNYTLHVDLIDVDQNAFSQFGVEPAEREIRIVN